MILTAQYGTVPNSEATIHPSPASVGRPTSPPVETPNVKSLYILYILVGLYECRPENLLFSEEIEN
jgi:hypothetical protein